MCSFPLLFSSSGLCDNIIQDIIATYLVLPNSISIPLVGESQLSQLRFPIPKVARDTPNEFWHKTFILI